jgi:hypothetical protein
MVGRSRYLCSETNHVELLLNISLVSYGRGRGNVPRTATCTVATPIPEAQLVSFDHFAHELTSQLRHAVEQGATTVVITSGQLCSSINKAGNWTEACCGAMQAEVKSGDDVLVEQGRGSGMTVRYRLPRGPLK